jgi:hypothetical protein
MHSGTGRQIIAGSLLASLLVAGHGCSREEAGLGIDEARELYALSHIAPLFDVAHEFLDAQIAMRQGTWSPEQIDVATRVIGNRLAAGTLAPRIIERLEAQPDPRFTDTVMEWLRTSEARQIHAATAATTDAEATAKFRDFMATERQLELSENRLALIERYDRAAHCSSDSFGALRLAIYGAAMMSDALAPSDARNEADSLRQFAEQKSELLEPVFEELSAVTLRFAFRGLSDADVAAFVERSESEPMQWYYRTLSNVFLETLEEISNDLGAAFVAALESQPDA